MSPPALLQAIDGALGETRRLEAAGACTRAGQPAAPLLARLAGELATQRARAAAGALPEDGWTRRTVRWVAEWLPDDELPLLARLGAIARAAGGS